MKIAVPLHMTEFLVAVAVVVAVIVFTEESAWQQISRLRKELNPEAIQRVHSGDRLRTAILDMDYAWKQSSETNSETSRASFELASQKVNSLLRKELAASSDAQERNLLQEIFQEGEAYQSMARKPLVRGQTGAQDKPPGFDREMGARLARLLALCDQLDLANSNLTHQCLDKAGASLNRLQRFLFASLLGLLICGAIVLVLTYRRMVGPLQSRLAESRTLIERQEKLASLGVFATGIAHEIRNPITAIKVRLFTLKSSHPPGSGEYEDLEVIESEINRLEKIVQEFLRFARPAEPDLLTVPLDTFLREVHDLLRPELDKRGIRFGLDLNANELVRIDPEKMKQVLLNFIQNAADSIEGNGAITLSSKKDRQMFDGRPLSSVAIEISDTGKGIPPEVQKRLFDPFFTTKENGTGLGLPIAARIVEKHGGLIQYRTQLNHGTTFSILLPRSQP